MKVPFFWLALGLGTGIAMEPFVPIAGLWLWSAILLILPVLGVARGTKIFLGGFLLLLALGGVLHARLNRANSPKEMIRCVREGRVSLEGIVETSPSVQTQGKKVKASFVLSARNVVQFHEGRRTSPSADEAGAGTQWESINRPVAERRGEGQRKFIETKGDVQVFLFQGAAPEFGDRVRLYGNLERPKVALNPGQFDYRKYLAQQKIDFIFRGYGGRSLRVLEKGQGAFFPSAIFRVRELVGRRIDRLFGKEEAIYVKALITGERKQIPVVQREQFMKTGTSHLWAISGMNIALVAGSFYILMILVGIPQRLAALVSVFVVAGYVGIAGGGIPVQRAGWMAGAAFVGLVAERESHSLNFFFFALFVLVLFDPLSLSNVSFQLSFVSVLALILFLKRSGDSWPWADNFIQSAVVMAGTFPIAAYHFNVFSPISLAANMIAIPLFHLALLSAFGALLLSPVPWIGFWIAHSTDFFLKCGLNWIDFCARFDWGYWFLRRPVLWHLGVYYVFLGIFLFLREQKGIAFKWATGVVLGVSLVVASAFFWPRRDPFPSVTFLAAGRNEIADIRFSSGDHWLVNTGRGRPSEQAQWIVGPYFRYLGQKRLGAILVTDFYQKHIGGLETLQRTFSIEQLLTPKVSGPVKALPKIRAQKVEFRAGDRFSPGPEEEILILDIVKGKTIFRLSSRGLNVLFLSALDSEVVECLLAHRAELRNIQVLALPSLHAPPPEVLEKLMEAVDPEFATSPGTDEAVQTFLSDRDIGFLNLENNGALTFRLENETGKCRVDSFLRGRIEYEKEFVIPAKAGIQASSL